MRWMRVVLVLAASTWACLGSHSEVALAQGWEWADDEAEEQTDISFSVAPAASGSLRVALDASGANLYELELTASEIRLSLKQTSHRILGRAPWKWSGPTRVVIQKRAWLLRVLIGSRVALTIYDASLRSGRVGTQARGGWKAEGVQVQPVESVFFLDDWTRAEGEGAEWTPESGAWRATATADTISSKNSSMSANPFAYSVDAGALAFARSGRRFWDNYEAEISVRPEVLGNSKSSRAGEVGLAVYAQNARNFLALRWSRAEGKAARRLVRVIEGQEQVLAQAAGAWLPGVWYRLKVQTSPGWIEAFIDGQSVLRARDLSLGQGGIALLAARTRATFDDARVRTSPLFQQTAGPSPSTWSGWDALGGKWSAAGDQVQSAPAAGEGERTRFYLSGRPDWNGYTLSARARAGSSGACGLAVGVQDDKNYAVFRWAGAGSSLPFRGRRQLMRYLNGRASILSDEPLGDLETKSIELRLDRGALSVMAGGQLIAQHADISLRSGRAALWAQGTAPVVFGKVAIAFAPEPIAPRVAGKMEGDSYMVGWASPAGEWPLRAGSNGARERWNTGDFFQNATLDMPWEREKYARGTLEIALRAREGDFDSGYVLQIKSSEDKSRLDAKLLRGGKELQSGSLDLQVLEGKSEDAIALRLEMEGRGLLISGGEHPLLSFLDRGTPPGGTKISVRSQGFDLSGQELRARSTHRDDTTFSDAPTDWYAGGGAWSVLARWPCFSDWSFFGGAGVAPTLWHKRVVGGDVVAEMYAHNQMDLPKEIGYSSPGNLNVTLCGDGVSPASGYAFVFAGHGNTRAMIHKQGQVLAERGDDKARFDRPINHFFPFHKRWLYVRAQARREVQNGKSGVRLQLWIDEEKILEAFDASPLARFESGGRVAFWGLDGSLLLARAKIESQNPGARFVPPAFLQSRRLAFEPPLDTAPFLRPDSLLPRTPQGEDGSPGVSIQGVQIKRGQAIQLENTLGGGLFHVVWERPKSASIKIEPSTRVGLEAQVPTSAKIDLYATIDGEKYLLELCGGQKPDASATFLGAFEAQTEPGGWKRYTLDIGEILKKRDPERKSWTLELLEMGALHGDEYRWAGFGGNPSGMQVLVRALHVVKSP